MKRFKNILCVADSKQDNNFALHKATKLTQSNQARLTVIEVVEDITSDASFFEKIMSARDLQAKMIHDCQANLNVLIEESKVQVDAETSVLVGIPFLEIIAKYFVTNMIWLS